MKHHECPSDRAPAYTGRPTPLRAVLVGEHAARALDLLLTRARSDPTRRLVLDLPLDEARSLVGFADACCDCIDEVRGRQRRDRDAAVTGAHHSSPCSQIDTHVES